MLVLILTWIGAAVTGSYSEAVGVSVILCPLCYLNVKGYRWSLLLFAALYTFDRVSVLYMRAESGRFGFGAVVAADLVAGYRRRYAYRLQDRKLSS